MSRATLVTVVGARPQFVKAAPLSRALRRRFREVLVHTGQHYDTQMSASFFEELDIPEPDFNLGIGSGPHGQMTGRMLEAMEGVLAQVKPGLVVVLGDTNSTLAGALAAVKMGIPVAHVEAGLRSFDLRMPEEINRRLTDHIASLLLCPTPAAVRNLEAEGLRRGVHRVGDVMMDVVLQNLRRAERRGPRGERPAPRSYYLATLHRQENVDDPKRLASILAALRELPYPVWMPLHPRTRERLNRPALRRGGSLTLRPPASYLEMLLLTRDARGVLTDSGGLQKEAFILGTPCVTLRETTEWVETLEAKANRLVGADGPRILRAVRALERNGRNSRSRRAAGIYGKGDAAERVAAVIARFLQGAR